MFFSFFSNRVRVSRPWRHNPQTSEKSLFPRLSFFSSTNIRISEAKTSTFDILPNYLSECCAKYLYRRKTTFHRTFFLDKNEKTKRTKLRTGKATLTLLSCNFIHGWPKWSSRWKMCITVERLSIQLISHRTLTNVHSSEWFC